MKRFDHRVFYKEECRSTKNTFSDDEDDLSLQIQQSTQARSILQREKNAGHNMQNSLDCVKTEVGDKVQWNPVRCATQELFLSYAQSFGPINMNTFLSARFMKVPLYCMQPYIEYLTYVFRVGLLRRQEVALFIYKNAK